MGGLDERVTVLETVQENHTAQLDKMSAIFTTVVEVKGAVENHKIQHERDDTRFRWYCGTVLPIILAILSFLGSVAARLLVK